MDSRDFVLGMAVAGLIVIALFSVMQLSRMVTVPSTQYNRMTPEQYFGVMR